MNSDFVVEAVGYLASALIVLSIIQTSILRLRLLSFAGSVAFVAYGIAIGAYPIAVVNAVTAAINGWHLRKLIRHKDELFRILHVQPDSSYLLDFMKFHREDIEHFQPDFVYRPSEDQVTAFILRDMVPAGLLIGEARDDGTFQVKLDYVIAQFRDFKIGSYVYSADSALLAGTAPTCVWAEASNSDHAKYLKRMGFTERPGLPGHYEIQLAAPASTPGAAG
jgi:hypothetical protein